MKHDGGPAFGGIYPGPKEGETWTWKHDGMTLRDYFAARVLPGVLLRLKDEMREEIAAECYALADAMLAEREKD